MCSLCIKCLPLKSSPKIYYLNEWANVFLCTCSVYPSSHVYMHIAHLWMSLYLWLYILGFCSWKFGLGISSVIIWKVVQFSSVAQLCLTLCNHMDCSTPDLPVPSSTPGAYSNSCPSSRWFHSTITSVIRFSYHLRSFPTSWCFPRSQFFASGGQRIGASVSASVLPMNIQNWFPLGLTGWISLQSKGLSRVFSNTTLKKHQFFSAQLSSQSNSHIHTWL